MRIIRFPTNRKKSRPTNPIHSLLTGPVTFTCPQCNTRSEFEIRNCTFRTVEFYCGGPKCGKYYKIINPAFIPPK